ncbi:MAG: class D sortase [Lachnospiraceae bacterium]|nr:class D sortase [Lachnospiraceae bacterium]
MKKKLILIIGIVIILGGLGAILYPIINQAVIASKQRKLMEQVKTDILNSISENNNNDTAPSGTPTPTPVLGDITAQTDGSSGIEGINLETGLANLTETENAGEENFDRSKLSWQKCIGVISIEKIDIVYAVVEGIEDINIFYAIGHFPDSVGIGKEGNCALAGHSGGTNGKFFQDLKDLEKGDEVVMTDLEGYEYTYVVTEIFVVNPEDVYVVQDLGKPGKYLTMVTCTNYGRKRLIVRAECTAEPERIREFSH